MPQSSKLVFFGTEDFSLPSLRALVEGGFKVVAVITKPDSARGRSKQLVAPAVKKYALSKNVPVLQPHRLADIQDELVGLDADAAVLVSYGKLLPQRTLDVFEPLGVINLHPSLLPRYRGPAPIEAAIENGDDITGISIMKLTLGMDEGPVFAQIEHPLNGTETRPQLTASLAEEGAHFLAEVLPDILSGALSAKPQKNSDVSYTSLLSKQQGYLDPTTNTAEVMERKVRAHLGFPKSRIALQDNDVIVTSATVVTDPSKSSLVVACKDNTYLEVLSLIAPSGKSMSGQAYLRGYKA